MNHEQQPTIEHPIGPSGRTIPNFLLIEERIVSAVQSANPKLDIQEFDFGSVPTNFKHIALNVDTTQIDNTRKGMNHIEVTSNVVLTLVIFKASNAKQRRSVAYPLVYGLMKLLSFQTLDLEMKPLIPQGFRNATDTDMSAKGLFAFQLKFQCSWVIAIETEEARFGPQSEDSIRDLSAGPVGELFKIALNYIETNDTQERTIDQSLVDVEN